MTVIATSAHTYWTIALVIGVAAALIVDGAAGAPAAGSRQHRQVGRRPARRRRSVAANTAYIPQLQATAPVLAQIVDEAVVQDGYMNALTDGFGDAA